MTRLGDIASKIRSKNAGPFWLTVDIFCDGPEAFERISTGMGSAEVARAFQVEPSSLRRFDIGALNVIKFSLPRHPVQGAADDRDMHGAAFGEILKGLEIA